MKDKIAGFRSLCKTHIAVDLPLEDNSDDNASRKQPSSSTTLSKSSVDNSLPDTPRLSSSKVYPMFKTQAEKQEAIRWHKINASHDEKISLSAFFKYGIQFHPVKGESEVHRSVLISNVAADVTLFDLLRQIRGGGHTRCKTTTNFQHHGK